jgi:uncharacterized alkaline shock family protein YloU
MYYEKTTEHGVISLDKGVIGSIIKRQVAAFDGKVLLSNAKGKVIKAANQDRLGDEANFFELSAPASASGAGHDLRVFVIIKMGVSISSVTDTLIARLDSDIMEFTGLRANSIAVMVKGMLSKNVSKRDIEVKR